MSKKFKLSLVVFIILVVSVVMVAGCVPKEKAEEEGKTFNAFLMEPVTLDAAHSQESEGIQVAKQIYDGLVDYNPETLELTAAMAESWEPNEDASVWTFNLKKGIKFHNGRECQAEDFVYSWSRVASKDTASEVAYHLSPIKGFNDCQEGKAGTLAGVKAIDDYTLEVSLDYSYGEFPVTLGHPVFFPVPKEEVEKWGDKFSEYPVGTGPFKFAEWTHDQHITLERFDDYYGDAARLDKVVFNIFADEETGYLEFEAGNLDDCQIPMGKIKEVQDKCGERALINPMLGIYYYGLNMQTEPWKDNVELRKALNYAIHRAIITDVVWEGSRVPATGIIPAGIPGFKENAMPYMFDQLKAKDLLEKAGYPDGKGLPKLTLGYNTGSSHDKVAQAVQAQMKEVGITFDITGYEWGAYLDKIQAEEITFFRLGWSADYPTMDNFLYPLFYSENAGADNMVYYNNSDVDKKLLEARRETDEAKRRKLYQEIEQIVLEDAPIVPIAFYKTTRVIGEDVNGYIRTAMDDTPYERVWFSK
ncbi:ABC transporter substrate-binding protein [Candidatus Oleimmundimicrobium sp.]|uniref:peptide ABC transporter substrate-binding protein n=1 Tax=Candidatus Oleimmundimicrobium sp. TaxID=3060597 RepID=UPI002718987B|nr:ABC transporter substrate-binding protein [Candidatus Oleimmundimicrobium sp.]MDO8885287.1 ABC transporter substrate-binding protein [Candidatus Oleimmundimicrobium sp.]